MRRIRWGALLACLGIVADVYCALVLSGCVGATRLPSRTNGPTGTTIQKNDIDMAFLQSGTTRREEVVNKLGRIDTGYSNSRMFWGRWSESKWGSGAVFTSAEFWRNWHVHNLLVTFDENGVMQTNEVIDDEKVLERELRAQLAKAAPLDLSQPLLITLTPYTPRSPHNLIDITLTKEGMQLRSDDAKSPVVGISPLKVVRINYDSYADTKSSSGSICHFLHLTENNHIDGEILVCTSAANLATLFKYFQQAGPPNMRWE